MTDSGSNRTVSRSAWLELKEEQTLVKDGYEFLDEKAMLLAAEMLEQKERYTATRKRFLALAAEAAGILSNAAADQGLDGLQVYPASELQGPTIEIDERSSIGQTMLEARFIGYATGSTRLPVSPAAVVQHCAEAFLAVMEAGAELAAMSSNLERLTREYRRTWRRVRALENVVLPEIRGDLTAMEEHLDLVEQEEIIRVRTAGVERCQR